MFQNILKLSLFGLLLVGCGGPSEYIITGTERAAGTDGLVTVETIEGNRMVTVEMEHLPPASRISETGTLYIVWIKPQGGTPSMAGRLEYDDDERTGTMRATTPHTNFQLMITVEADATASSPSDIVVARQQVEEDED